MLGTSNHFKPVCVREKSTWEGGCIGSHQGNNEQTMLCYIYGDAYI